MSASASLSSKSSLWRARSPFLLRKVHSLTGVLPVGVFLVEHLWTNATAAAGRASFDHAVGTIQKLPFLPLIEIFGIFLPLTFHALYGFVLLKDAKLNPGPYAFNRNWAYILQRASGMLVFAFVLWHLWEFRVQKWLFGMRAEAFYPTLVAHLSDVRFGVPWMAVFYLVSIAAACFHFANGLWGVCCSWGITVSRRAQSRAAWLFAAGGLALFVLGANTVIYLANGTRILPFADAPNAVGAERVAGPTAAPEKAP